MKDRRIVVWAALLACALPVSRAQDAGEHRAGQNAADGMLARQEALLGSQHQHGSIAPEASGPALLLEDVERTALAENPEIHVAVRRVAAAESHVPLAGALDDPQLMYRGWAVPLAKPWDYNQAQNMVSIGQMFPGRGKRDLRTDVARANVDQAKAELAMTRLRVRIEARKAFFDLLRAQDELRIHEQHVGIAHQAIEAAKIKYTVGKIPQVEILKAQLALTRLAEHMIRFERDANVARAHLNTLLGREPWAPLTVHGEYGLDRPLPKADALVAQAMRERPDLQSAAASAEKSRREQKLAKSNFAPDFNVAAGYMLMPTGSDFRNNYMVEGSITLPWLNKRRHGSEVAEATAMTNEKDAELDALRNTARGQIQEALAEAESAQELAKVYQDSLRKDSEQTLHAAVIAYENDQTSFMDLLDSQMAVVDIDLAWIDALGEFNKMRADLEMAVGAPIEAQQVAGEEKKP